MKYDIKTTASASRVSIICLCFEQVRFISECLDSVAEQSYPNIEVIIVDDASTDCSAKVIQSFIAKHPDWLFIRNQQNIGNCASFNKALKVASGKYVIDLAGDDVMHRDRVKKQVGFFEGQSLETGVVYSNSYYIDSDSVITGKHFGNSTGEMPPPDGDLYSLLISRHFISAPTMMFRKSALDEMGGYDESLSYEDYDFWVRSSRKYLYAYQNELLTFKRVVAGSLSSHFYRQGDNPHLYSTLLVCRKAFSLNRTPAENLALSVSVAYHLRQCVFAGAFETGIGFFELLSQLREINPVDRFFSVLCKKQIGLSGLYAFYLKALY